MAVGTMKRLNDQNQGPVARLLPTQGHPYHSGRNGLIVALASSVALFPSPSVLMVLRWAAGGLGGELGECPCRTVQRAQPPHLFFCTNFRQTVHAYLGKSWPWQRSSRFAHLLAGHPAKPFPKRTVGWGPAAHYLPMPDRVPLSRSSALAR